MTLKIVILAGGKGTRFKDLTTNMPKPMITIGDKPILWHIMKHYSIYGFNDFIVCSGYKSNIIEKFYDDHNSLIPREWNVQVVNTGDETMTGGRIKKISEYIDGTFGLTYGDTLNDVNINSLYNFHKKMGKQATITACQPPNKFGILDISEDLVVKFIEKPKNIETWVNGGYFFLEHSTLEHIAGDETYWEDEPIQKLIECNQLAAYKHYGFYQPMDTISDREVLEDLWKSGNAQWLVKK